MIFSSLIMNPLIESSPSLLPILVPNTAVLHTDRVQYLSTVRQNGRGLFASSFLHPIAFRAYRILSLLMQCLFRATHTRPNIFYFNSSWPWSCDMVERYIVSNLSLIIVTALTFGNYLYISLKRENSKLSL